MNVEEELVGKVEKLMQEKFGGTDAAARRRLFDAYDSNADGQVDSDELTRLLADAGVGNAFTRGMWVKGVIAKLDTDKSATISFDEFEAILS